MVLAALLLLLILVKPLPLLLLLLLIVCPYSLELLPFFGSPIPYPDGGHFLVGQPIATFFFVSMAFIRGMSSAQGATSKPIFATSHRVSLSTASSRSPSLALTLWHEPS